MLRASLMSTRTSFYSLHNRLYETQGILVILHPSLRTDCERGYLDVYKIQALLTVFQFSMLRRGGEEVLLDVGGQDATEAFEDVGHSDEAREILQGLLVGNLKRKVRYSPLPSAWMIFVFWNSIFGGIGMSRHFPGTCHYHH